MKVSKEMFELAQSASSAEDLAGLFESAGHKLSVESAEKIFASVQQTELGPEDFNLVSGGCSSGLSKYDGAQCKCGSTDTTCTDFHGYGGGYQISYHCNSCQADFTV